MCVLHIHQVLLESGEQGVEECNKSTIVTFHGKIGTTSSRNPYCIVPIFPWNVTNDDDVNVESNIYKVTKVYAVIMFHYLNISLIFHGRSACDI